VIHSQSSVSIRLVSLRVESWILHGLKICGLYESQFNSHSHLLLGPRKLSDSTIANVFSVVFTLCKPSRDKSLRALFTSPYLAMDCYWKKWTCVWIKVHFPFPVYAVLAFPERTLEVPVRIFFCGALCDWKFWLFKSKSRVVKWQSRLSKI
jgi:hypothetical protein